MTNEEIIYRASIDLVKEGKLKTVETPLGTMPEPIHTFAGWKARGYSVKKGEHSEIKLTIWKCKPKEIEVDGETKEVPKMFSRVASFFTAEQVEPMTAEA